MPGQEAAQLTSQVVREELERGLSPEERDLLNEIFRSLRVIRYGSVLLTVHDGHVVEIQKTERIRKGSAKQA
jgi:hypothetical protein